MERDADYLGRYRSISNKLKKRFLKKPNVAEGSEQFASLGKTFRQQECQQYAGFCSLAQARCEHTLANPAGEAQALTEAGRAFMEAEMADRELDCPCFEENLTAAINCYGHAVRVHIESKQSALAAALCVELGDSLRGLGKSGEAMAHYQRAAELQYQNPLDCLFSMGFVATCKIETGDFDGALAVLTEMAYLAQERGGGNSGKPLGAFCDILARCEVTRVLLLMLLQPTPQRIRPEHAQTLEKYTWGASDTEDSTSVQCINEDLFLLLQSVVMACQSRDTESLKSLQVELWPLLSAEQNQLLHLVVKELSSSAKE
ncbi:factor VIII intron 22 protein [Lingula anatina]|uniref:Factor VIII intron 22 protein n=1 Tax=Lingula anatina TaxID=7574 RepID=A0A1S3IQY1_LINAN|nr:factor VIII intron 22 protein [Lingula anatina]|eukprot:XP_013400326.1 factor VIII intron 22 protein [Lingula anatina]